MHYNYFEHKYVITIFFETNLLISLLCVCMFNSSDYLIEKSSVTSSDCDKDKSSVTSSENLKDKSSDSIDCPLKNIFNNDYDRVVCFCQ